MNGKYEESIYWDAAKRRYFSFRVTKESWLLSFYFAGPDFRHKGTLFDIPQGEVDAYVAAYRLAWAEYLDLQNKIPEGGTFRKSIPVNGTAYRTLGINVGTPGALGRGVCIYSYDMPIDSEEDINALIAAFAKCKERAPSIMAWLASN
jgi:hypothetical protein